MFFLVLFATVLVTALNGWLLNKVLHKIWNLKPNKWLVYIFPLTLIFFLLSWWLGTGMGWWWLRLIGSSGAAITFVLNIFFLITLPISLLIRSVYRFFNSKNKVLNHEIDNSRRVFLKTAISGLPILALSSTGTGFLSSFSQTRFPQITMNFPNLPDELNGFKILQLTDLHLGYYFGLDHLENTLLDAEKYNPDMIVVTGDIADDLNIMTDAMNLIGQFKTPYPKFSSLGNHEYFRGIKKSIREIEKGPIPLLINSATQFNINGVNIVVGGADDPVRLGGDKKEFYENALNNTFKDSPQGDFRLLLSHRPNALDLAENYNIDLTLSGHTHGGQVGLGGRSFWDIFSENAYLWGSYQKGKSRLYTSSGMGHWFPFRLNCPLEAPLITLKKPQNNII